ncbi:Hsp20/alpha crystallin family protein [Bradyrhizobium guangdongense]
MKLRSHSQPASSNSTVAQTGNRPGQRRTRPPGGEWGEGQEPPHGGTRRYGGFSRSLPLPSGIDADQIKATLPARVLKVVIPKPASSTPRKIEVKGS